MGLGNRHSTSNEIRLDLIIAEAAGNRRSFSLVQEEIAKLMRQLDLKLNLGIDPKQLTTIEGIEQVMRDFGITATQNGRKITLMAKNAEGLEGSLSRVVSVWKQVRDEEGHFTGTFEKLAGKTIGGEMKFNKQPVVEDIQTVTNEYSKLISLEAQLRKEGWNTAQATQEQRKAYADVNEELELRKGRFEDVINLENVQDASLESQIGHTREWAVANIERTKAIAEGKVASQNQAEAQRQENQQAQEYLRLLKEEYRAEEQLAAAKQKSGNENVVKNLEDQIKYYHNKRSAIESNVKATEAYKNIENQATEATLKHKTAMAQFTNTVQKTGGVLNNIKSMLTNVVVYGTAYKALYAVMNGFKETINIVKELDKSLVDLQIATGKTREEASQMLDTYNQMAQTLGSTTKEVADSSVQWLRQGYSEADTNKLIYDSMVLSKVGMIESAEATKYLTSAMKGYQVSVDDAMSIVDKLSKIDLNAAVSSGELAEAMSKTANSARLAGVSMDELLGYIATTAEVTQQSASTVGTAFKSLFSRFSKIAAGTFVDEETGENLNEISRVLGKLNIELYRTDGSMRSVSEVLKEVSAGWKNYTDVEKNSISTAVAGRRLPEYIVICSAA